jgi:hypothetical protein
MTLMCRWSMAAVTCLAALVIEVGAQPTAEGPDELAARLRAYLTTYEAALGEVVAIERMTQRTGPHILSDGETNTSGAPRVLESDVAFVGLPGGAGWLGYRDVLRRNGRPLRRTGPPLHALLAVERTESQDRARALLIASAAHNLGAPRTINLPSLPLEFLHGRNTHRLTIVAAASQLEGRSECRGRRLDFRESALPTLIQRPEGGDMPSRVAAWVEPGSGRLCKAEVRTRDGHGGDDSVEAVVRVEFERDTAVGLTVPRRMEEEFFVPPLGRGTGEARYSNYRRFRTSGRLVPPVR